jgi:carboxymethylenebutenolidase
MTARTTSRFRFFLVLGPALLGCFRAEAAERTAVTTATVEFRGGSGPIKGFLARPKGDGPFPAVVIVHEWWGLTDWIKENAERLAGEGYVALAVDLYGGKVTTSRDEAHELSRALDPQEAVADLKGGVAYLKTLSFVARDQKQGAIGWCLGGLYSRLLSQSSDAIGPTVICYGSVTTDPEQIAKLKGKPILGIFGFEDRGIPPAKVHEFRNLLRQEKATATIQVFQGAGHGFMRPGGGQYNAEAANSAWRSIDKFFAENLAR